MILIVNICKEKLHYYEFVKPIEDIIKGLKLNCFVKNFKDINDNDLKNCSKVIICGTSLYDNYFISELKKFEWIKEFNKPILGICGGMQIIGLVFGGNLKRKTEIGFYKEIFNKEFLGIREEVEVYHLHNNYINFKVFDFFDIYSSSIDGKIPQAIKHKTKEIYGVLFHPEVRNKDLIKNYILKTLSKDSLERFY